MGQKTIAVFYPKRGRVTAPANRAAFLAGTVTGLNGLWALAVGVNVLTARLSRILAGLRSRRPPSLKLWRGRQRAQSLDLNS